MAKEDDPRRDLAAFRVYRADTAGQVRVSFAAAIPVAGRDDLCRWMMTAHLIGIGGFRAPLDTLLLIFTPSAAKSATSGLRRLRCPMKHFDNVTKNGPARI